MRRALVVAVMTMGLTASFGSLWVSEHRSLDHQVTAMRAFHGLPPIPEDPALSDLATEHSWRMARTLSLFHSTDPELAATPGEWESVGQNVGRASKVWLVVRAFMDSPEHRELILGDWTSVGYGHIRAGGEVYVTLWFRK